MVPEPATGIYLSTKFVSCEATEMIVTERHRQRAQTLGNARNHSIRWPLVRSHLAHQSSATPSKTSSPFRRASMKRDREPELPLQSRLARSLCFWPIDFWRCEMHERAYSFRVASAFHASDRTFLDKRIATDDYLIYKTAIIRRHLHLYFEARIRMIRYRHHRKRSIRRRRPFPNGHELGKSRRPC